MRVQMHIGKGLRQDDTKMNTTVLQPGLSVNGTIPDAG